MQIFQSAVQKLSLYPTRGKRTKINYRNSVTQYLALVKKYHLYIVSFCYGIAQKIHQKAQDLQKFGRHLLYIERTDMVRDSPAGLHALFVP